MDKKTRIAMARVLLKLAKHVKAEEPGGTSIWEDSREEKFVPPPKQKKGPDDSAKLLRQNPQLNSIARRLHALGLSTSDMMTAMLMAMRMKGDKATANQAYNLLRPLLKKITWNP